MLKKAMGERAAAATAIDRKSTRLNSSHLVISYAVFCLKKKKNNDNKSANCRRCVVQAAHDCELNDVFGISITIVLLQRRTRGIIYAMTYMSALSVRAYI